MKLTAENIFEAQISSTAVSKILGLNFISIKKDESGKYFGHTQFLDAIIFLAWVMFSFSVALETWKNSVDTNSNRSFIFEFIVTLSGKFESFRVGLELFQIFFFRFEYFKILENIHWIDEKVYCNNLNFLYFQSLTFLFFLFFSFRA